MGIPERLRDPDYAFIKVCRPECQSHYPSCRNPGKMPVGERYTLHSIEEVDKWLENGGNAGIVAKGELVFIDVDDPELADVVRARLPTTFTVRTGKGYHYYFNCPEWDSNLTFRDFEGEIASFRADDKYVAIPPSVHPSGKQYKVAEDRPIQSIERSDLESVKTAFRAVIDDRIKSECSAIKALLNAVPEDERDGGFSLVPDNDTQSPVDEVMRLRCRTRTWQMWVTRWLRAVGLPVEEIVDDDVTEILIQNARQEEFDKEETLRQIQTTIENSRTSDEELLNRAQEAAQNSNTNRIKTGAAVQTETGDVYTGSIVETRDRHQSIHAERLAIFKAISEGANYITDIAVYVDKPTPRICGSCLQVIYEFSAGRNPTVLTKNGQGEVREQTLKDLYPEPWLPEELMFS